MASLQYASMIAQTCSPRVIFVRTTSHLKIGKIMTDLNANSERMVLIIHCSVKNADKFKQWSKDRASKYVYDLKEQNSISYEWHLSADGTETTLIESFIDSDSMMVRLANHGASPLSL